MYVAPSARRAVAAGLLLLISQAIPASAGAQPTSEPNVLLIVLDDVGVDLIGRYDAVAGPTPIEHTLTPSIHGLADEGVLFLNAWSDVLCIPTRATILTGRYRYRVAPGSPRLRDYEQIIPELLPAAYANVALGKWHVTNYIPSAPPPTEGTNPVDAGFDEFRGSPGNFNGNYDDYFDWMKGIEPAPEGEGSDWEHSTTYATTDIVDDALAWIGQQTGPWFMWLAFQSVHTPIQGPPAALHSIPGVLEGVALPIDPPPDQERDYRNAMLEAMDNEISRLLTGVDLATTTVIVVGDNGTKEPVPGAINRGNKRNLFEGGINVPLIIAGAGVDEASKGQETEALTHTVDLFATVLELAGGTPPAGVEIDSVSLVPVLDDWNASVRATVYAEGLSAAQPIDKQDVAIRDDRYKLIRYGCDHGVRRWPSFYDLESDPSESVDLFLQGMTPDETAAFQALRYEIIGQTGALPTCPDPGVPCGLGFELAFVVPALRWLRRRAGRARTSPPSGV